MSIVKKTRTVVLVIEVETNMTAKIIKNGAIEARTNIPGAIWKVQQVQMNVIKKPTKKRK